MVSTQADTILTNTNNAQVIHMGKVANAAVKSNCDQESLFIMRAPYPKA